MFVCLGKEAGMSTSPTLVAALLSFSLLAWPVQPASATEAGEQSDADKSRLIDQLFGFTSKHASPGAAVIVIKNGRILHKKGYGLANLEHDIPITSETAFRIGSITKPFTAIAILQLHERGLLSIDDTVAKYLPRSPNARKITIRHLLTHTSGLSDFRSRLAQYEPGEKTKYSNAGYLLLGKLIEKVSRTSYDRYLQDNIFAPLGMSATGCDYPGRIVKNRASGYITDADGAFRNEPFIDMDIPFSAGGLYSTLDDLYLFDQALYTDKLVKQETITRAFSPAELNDGSLTDYGLGWMLRSNHGLKEVAHGGAIGGFNACIVRCPDVQFTVVVLSNLPVDPLGPIPTAEKAVRRITDIYLADKRPPDAKASGISAKPSVPFSGEISQKANVSSTNAPLS
jgi:CubicO group peptidase (beta-lactamase class C family)